MKIRVDNKDNPAEKRCFVDTERLEVAAFLSEDHFVIERIGVGDLGDYYDELWLNQKEFNELYEMMTEMKKLMED
nr:MAG TPA: hypothetical protein [Caudoviricetes sp.]